MKIKTTELTGAALDWAVAKAKGFIDDPDSWLYHAKSTGINNYHPSTNWGQGGPIIERKGINLGTQRNEPGFRPHPDYMWHAQMDTRVYVGYGPTPLIAAMRCYVASQLGDEVDVPDELI